MGTGSSPRGGHVSPYCSQGLWLRLCFQLDEGGWDSTVGSTVLLSYSYLILHSHPKDPKSTMPRGEKRPLQKAFPRPLPVGVGETVPS